MISTDTTSYLLDKNRPYAQVFAEYTNGSLDASYLYGLDLISQERGGVDSYYLVDGLGSTRGLTDENGNVTDVYSYDAYGNLTDSVGSSENRYLFAGEQFDESLDQYYLRQRYYDPSAGRFTRRDTYEGNNFDPITLHKYLYANANPVNAIDLSGLNFLDFSLSGLTLSQKIGATLIAAAATTHVIRTAQNPPERLKGFGDGGQPTLDDLSPRPRDPRDTLLQRLLSYPVGGGFGAGRQPDLPTHTGHSPDNTIYDLIRYIFNSSIPKTRVGRWMSTEEYQKMLDTGFVQEGGGGQTYVANPANPEAYRKQAKPGSVYVEFDIPNASIRPTTEQEGWAVIPGPNSIFARLAARKGLPVPQMPVAENITLQETK